METAAEPTWVSLKDEELLALRICDLGVACRAVSSNRASTSCSRTLLRAASPSVPIATWATNGSRPKPSPPSPCRSIWRIPA